MKRTDEFIPELPFGGAGAIPSREPRLRPRRKPKATILIGICSCCHYSEKREAVRKTWMKRLPDGISAVFFVGKSSSAGNGKIPKGLPLSSRQSLRPSSFEKDVISLGAPDDYKGLPKKVQAFFQYALEHYEFDYLFKCDDDTYVRSERLFDLLKAESEFVGSGDWWPSHADGGAGYLLSRQSVVIAANAACPETGPEDVWVTNRSEEPASSGARLPNLDTITRSLRTLAIS